MTRTALSSIVALSVAAAAGAACGWAAEPSGRAAPRYSTPTECPQFREPQFISRPLRKAYPGIEYNMRPAIKGGTSPYVFTLEAAPRGMKIDPAKGTVTWLASEAGGVHDVTIRVRDAVGVQASQGFQVTVSKEGFYFVSPAGDDANPGSIDKPWRTVERAAVPPHGFAYADGAVVVFRGGEYKIDRPAPAGSKAANSVPISAAAPKYWLAYPGEKPVIDLGWSAEQQQSAHQEQRRSGRLLGGGKEPSTQRGYGHRFALVGGSDYFYMDGFEIKNACYYMFVMWDGRNTVHFRRCDMHHLWADWAENPAFIFTFAGDRKGDFNAWGVRPKCSAYRNFVIQENRFHDRFFVRDRRGGHGGGMVFYTVHDSVIEENDFREIHRGECFCDKDNGLGNTYRGNTIHGDCSLLGQWNSDEIEISHNYIDGRLRVGLQPGWIRNIWVHHNAIKGSVALMGGATQRPEKFDATKGDYSSAQTADTAKAIREFPAEKRLVHVYRNVIDAPRNAIGDRTPGVIAAIPNNKGFADRWRYVRWDENLVDSGAKIELLWNRYTDFSLFKACGFDQHGARAPVTLDAQGRLPLESPYRGKFGR